MSIEQIAFVVLFGGAALWFFLSKDKDKNKK